MSLLATHSRWLIVEEAMRGEDFSQEEIDVARAEWWQAAVGHVDLRTFVESPYFMNAKGVLYPRVLDELEAINYGEVSEVVLTGGIGTAKSTIALYTQAFQLYILSRMDSPHAVFDLDPSSEILIVFQNIKKELAKAVDYDRFRVMIDRSPYFTEKFPFRRDLESELHFPNRIIVKPVVGTETGAIGQNVIGGVIDEINFMSVVEKSRKSGDGGTYNQAVSLYNSIARRRESRFIRMNKLLPGRLCLVSSRKYPGQFTDKKEAERAKQIAETGHSFIYVYDKRVWEICPPGRFSGVMFNVFKGDVSRKPRIMAPAEQVPPSDQHLVIPVPVEYRHQFIADIFNALRDIAGVSTLATSPFLPNVTAVAACFGKAFSILTRDDVDFVTTDLAFYKDRFEQPDMPRWAHVDLGLTGDSAGVAMGWVPRFVTVDRGDGGKEILPVCRLDFLLEVRPPPSDEIKFDSIRRLFYKLREHGLNLKWISFDSYQSVDSIQILRTHAFVAGEQSMDRDMIAYDVTKQALYDGRVEAPEHARCQSEAARLERDTATGKVDHPPEGSKDIFDALAGTVYGLSTKREYWRLHNIPLIHIPASLARGNTGKRSVEKAEERQQAVASGGSYAEQRRRERYAEAA